MYLSRKTSWYLLLLVVLPTIARAEEEPKLQVVATASMISDMVSEIAGDRIDLQCIVPIGGDPHLYEATPRDAQLVAQAHLIFKNGLTFEGWLNELIDNAGSNAQVITVTDGIDPIKSLIYDNAVDPHAWMDVTKGLTYIANIRDALVAADSAHATVYRQNYERYRVELEETDQYIRSQIAQIPAQRRVLITSHDAFQYYGRQYGLQLESVLGVSTDADIQTSDIVRLNKVIRERQVPALFVESTINPKVLEQLAEDNDISIGGQLYADSIGDEDSPASSYIKMLRHNTDVITGALTRAVATPTDTDSRDAKSTWLLYGLLAILLVASFTILVKKLN